MNTGWKTSEMQRHEGKLTLIVVRSYEGNWSAFVYLSHAWQSTGHTISPRLYGAERFTSSMDAIDAAEHYATQLGPVEPVMALITAFSRGETYQRRTRQVAA